ncbi:glycosyltransferase [Herbiconiux solani]|uniref:glycosyltransferase n=1 Tax=Herbiconiux solani TaxID=661329 RepID=UPI000A04FAB9|nr:glycosyltransferase family A protein [Herbiconiux solani]
MAISISVVIPARDDAAFLRRALDALAAQERPADEVIVVDNGSSDDTADVARSFGARVIDEPVQGILRATAAGFDAARGDVLARIDADSVPGPDWLRRVETVFLRPDAPTGYTGPGLFYDIGAAGAWAGQTFYLGGYVTWMTLFLGHAPLFGSNMALQAAAWRRIRSSIHRTDRRVHDDLDIAYHLLPDMTVEYDPTLAMPISGRPFHSASGFFRRIGWAFRTIAVNIPGQWPWQRWSRRRAARQARQTPQARQTLQTPGGSGGDAFENSASRSAESS